MANRQRGEERRHQAERHEQLRLLRPLDGCHHHDVKQHQHGDQSALSSFPSRGVLHVAERDGEIVGFQSVEPFASYTRAFDHVGVIGTFVRLDTRRQGVGRALFAATLTAVREMGYEKLSTFIRADNPAARGAYAAQGFREIGVAARHAKIDGVYIDEVLVERAL